MRGSKRKILRLLARIKRDGFQTPDQLRAAAAAAASARISPSEALRYYEDLREQGRRPNRRAIAAALRACGSYKDLETGRKIHGEIGTANDPKNIIAGSLVAMYAQCGEIGEAQRLFQGMGERKRPMVAWNAMIMGYARAGMGVVALEVFHSMHRDGVRPDKRSLRAAIGACEAVAVDGCQDERKKKRAMEQSVALREVYEKMGREVAA